MFEKEPKHDLEPSPIASSNSEAFDVLRVRAAPGQPQQLGLRTTWKGGGAWGLLLLSALVSIQFCAGYARQRPKAEYRPTTTIKNLMGGIVNPGADTIWGSVAVTNGKEEKAPHTYEEWVTIRRSALQLVEASNLLQIPGRLVAKPGERNEQGIELQPEQIEKLVNQDRPAWISLAHGLHDAATLAINAADEKDLAKMLEIGSQTDDACEHCHQRYWYPRPAQSSGK